MLIGFADEVAGPEVAFSVLDAGFEVLAFTRRGAAPSLNRCPAVRVVEITTPVDDARAALRDLERQVEATRPDVILPLGDDVLALCDSAGEEVRSRVAGPTGAHARFALDKRLQMGAALLAGFDVVPTRSFESADELLETENEFPLLVKPALAVERGETSFVVAPIALCTSAAELAAAVRVYGAGSPVIVQPFVPGHMEGLFGLARNGEVLITSAHRRLRAVGSAKGWTSACASLPVDPELESIGRSMLADAEWNGLFMLEFLRDDDGRARFLEFNGRAWGSMALARRMGFEYPAWAALQKLDASFSPPHPPPAAPITCRHLGREILHVLGVMRGPGSPALWNGTSRRRALKEVLRISRDDRWYNVRKDAPGLFVQDTFKTVSAALRTKIRPGSGSARAR